MPVCPDVDDRLPPGVVVVVDKSELRLGVYRDGRLLAYEGAPACFPVALGAAPEGDKRARGDERTPEGWFRVTHRNPQSSFHLSLGLSYPTTRHAELALAEGRIDRATRDRVVVSDLTVEQLAGSSPPAPAAPAEVVLANVLIGVIEDHAGHLVALVAPGGALVVSGVLDTQIDRALAAITAAAASVDRPVTLCAAASSGAWRAVVFRIGHQRVKGV